MNMNPVLISVITLIYPNAQRRRFQYTALHMQFITGVIKKIKIVILQRPDGILLFFFYFTSSAINFLKRQLPRQPCAQKYLQTERRYNQLK